jgi:hypothetical protein
MILLMKLQIVQESRRAVEMHAGFWWENLRERDHSENLGVDGRIILKWIVRKYVWRAWTFHLSQDRDRWQAVVNAVMNLRVP